MSYIENVLYVRWLKKTNKHSYIHFKAPWAFQKWLYYLFLEEQFMCSF
jgi:hypothetical protein